MPAAAVAGALAGAAATSAAYRRRLRRERRAGQDELSRAARLAILRPLPERIGRLGLAVRHRPAANGAGPGGDLYDVLESAYGVRLLLGDARGRGLAAVRLAGAVLGCFREVGHTCPDLGAVAEALDAAARRHGGEEEFVPAVLAEVEGGRLRWVVCGHPVPLHVRDGRLGPLTARGGGLPLGLGGARHLEETELAPGDRLLLHTKGVVDLDVGAVLAGPADAALDALLEDLDGRDDATVLLVALDG